MEGRRPGAEDASAFFSAEGPLVCFVAVSHEEAFTTAMGLISQKDTIVCGCNVCMHVYPVALSGGRGHVAGGTIYTALIRVPGRIRGFLDKIDQISAHFAGNILLCNPQATEQAFRITQVDRRQVA